MRLDEFKTLDNVSSGDQTAFSTSSANSLVKKISQYCSEFLNARNQTEVLYRGFGNYVSGRNAKAPKYFVGSSRDDRLPIGSDYSNRKNSSQIDQLSCDLCLQLENFTALRSNSTFCNSALHKADGWGRLYVVFPVNGFTYSWSGKWSGVPADCYSFPSNSDHRAIQNFILESDYNGKQLPTSIPQSILDIAKKFVEENRFYNDDLNAAMRQQKDLWFRGKYIAVDHNVFKSIKHLFVL